MLAIFIKNRKNILRILKAINLAFFFILIEVQGQITHHDWISISWEPEKYTYLEELNSNEQEEQYRDWIKYCVINSWGFTSDDKYNLLYDFNPFRYDFLSRLSDYEFGSYRYIINKDEIIAIVPDSLQIQQNCLGHIADEYRMMKGNIPTQVHIIEYDLSEAEEGKVRYRFKNTVKGEILFSSIHGYTESDINNPNQLKRFLEKIDDIVFARKSNQGVVFGGRKYSGKPSKNVILEDIAVLYQADNNAKEQYLFKLDKRGFYREYLGYQNSVKSLYGENSLAELRTDIKKLEGNILQIDRLLLLGIKTYEGISLVETKTRLEEELYIQESNLQVAMALASYNTFVPYYIEKLNIQDGNVNIGFSLDPTIKYSELAYTMKKIANDTTAFQNWYEKNLKEQDRKLAIVSLQSRMERSIEFELNYMNSKGTIDEEIDDYLVREHNLQSLLETRSEKAEVQNEDYEKIIKQKYKITELDIDAEINYYYKSLQNAIKENRIILTEISDWILKNELGKDWEKMALFYTVNAYWSDRLNFSFRADYLRRRFESYEKKTYGLIVKDISTLLKYLGYLDNPSNKFDEMLGNAIKNFRERYGLTAYSVPVIDNELLGALMDRAGNLVVKSTNGALHSLLFNLRAIHSYQKGRYDGNLQGTRVGMILYYTDLVMKLWSFDYKKTAPQAVAGFFPETRYPVSVVHQRSASLNSSTRSWLSFTDDKVGYHNDGELMAFAHIATKIYNASSNDLQPGKEVDANYSSQRFANWWNKNYSKVADYEPEYHRLNQVQKWSNITHWLKEVGRFSWLDNPNLVNVRNLDFEQWYNTPQNLKVSVPIEFLSKRALGEKTECIAIIESDPYFPYINSSAIYHFAGGVSLSKRSNVVQKMFAKKPRIWRNSDLDRFNIKYTNHSNLFSKTDGKSFLLNPKSRTVNISRARTQGAGKPPSYSGSDLHLYDLSINREIGSNGQIIQKTSNVSGREIELGSLNADYSLSGKNLKISIKESELIQKKQLLEDLGKKSYGKYLNQRIIFSDSRIDDAFQINRNGFSEYLIKLEGSPNYLLIKSTKIPPGRIDAPIGDNLSLRMELGPKYYLDTKIVSPLEASLYKANFRYQKIVRDPFLKVKKVILTNEPPPLTGKKVYFSESGVRKEVTQTKDAWYFKNTEDPTELVRTVKSSDEFLRSQVEEASGIIFDRNSNKYITFGEKTLSKAESEWANQSLNKFRQEVDAVIFNDGTDIRFVNENTLTIPSPDLLTNDQILVLEKVAQKIKENPFFKKLWQKYDIELTDLRNLEMVNAENFHLSESYYAFKYTDLNEGTALLDWNSSSVNSQVIIKDGGKDLPKILSLKNSSRKSLKQHSDELSNMYSSEVGDFKTSFEANSKPIFEALETIAQQTKARNIITRGDGINAQKIYSYFGGEKVRFCKDETDNVGLSVGRVSKEIYLDYFSSIFLSSVDLSDNNYPDIRQAFEEVEKNEIPTFLSLTSEDFYEFLLDSAATQIYLLIRGNERGIIFSDRLVSYQHLESWLEEAAIKMNGSQKDFIYVITNECKKLEEIFIKKNLFNFVYTSCYTAHEPNSVARSIQRISSLTQSYQEDVYSIKTKKINKILIKDPELKKIMDRVSISQGKKTQVNVGKLNKIQLDKVPEKLSALLFGKGNVYKPKEVNELFHKSQKEELQLLKREQTPLKSRFRGIPEMKCYIIPVKNDKVLFVWRA